MRRLIDEYVSAQGVDPKIPPICITDVEFNETIKGKKSARARASEMKHALRFHLRIKGPEDPAFYRSLSERLEEILQTLKDNWEQLEQELARLIKEVNDRETEVPIQGLEPKVHAPFLGLLSAAAGHKGSIDATSDEFKGLIDLTQNVVKEIRKHIVIVDFWRDQPSQKKLETALYRLIRRSKDIPEDKRVELSSRLVELARTRHRWLIK